MMGKSLTLREKIGQKLVVGFHGAAVSDALRRMVSRYKIGNIILFKRNLENKEQIACLCRELKQLIQSETGASPFIAIDQEGGAVSRLPQDASNIPGPMAIAATGHLDYAFQCGFITAKELLEMGVNFNLAPALDTNSNSENPVIGVRSFSDSPQTVAQYGVEMIRGLIEGGVLCAGKHFPGHGDTNTDSHLGLPVVDKSLDELEKVELYPFKAAIKAGIPAVMSSHILFPQLEPEKLPATMSRRILTDLLKGSLGYQGLILTDCLEMDAIGRFYGTTQGALSAVKAGADLLFISHTAAKAEEAAQAIYEAVENGAIDLTELDTSVNKILRYKETFLKEEPGNLELVGCKEHQEVIRKVMQESITPVHLPGASVFPLGEKPVFVGFPEFRPTMASDESNESFSFPQYMANQLQGGCLIISNNPQREEIEEIVKKTQGGSCIVVGTYNGHVYRGQIDLVNALAKTGTPVIAIAFRNPYDLKWIDAKVCTIAAYEYSQASFDAVSDFLIGKINGVGTLSVRI